MNNDTDTESRNKERIEEVGLGNAYENEYIKILRPLID